jgi:hypothetical protein
MVPVQVRCSDSDFGATVRDVVGVGEALADALADFEGFGAPGPAVKKPTCAAVASPTTTRNTIAATTSSRRRRRPRSRWTSCRIE